MTRSADPRHIDTGEFRRSSPFSRALRRALAPVILRLSVPEDRAAFAPQLPEASRNVEIAVEQLARLLATHPIKAGFVVATIRDWLTRYFGAQRRVEDRPRILVYTDLDARIPFVPEEDTMYTYMIAQIAYVAGELCAVVSARDMRAIAAGFMEANRLGEEVFLAHPTVMPRFRDHDRLSLRVIQRLDAPVNCCPSLHITYSLLLDNLAAVVFAPHPERREAWDAVRYSTTRMFNSVLYTKQHSLIDVAFGILCARIVHQRHFAPRFGRPFDDLLGSFTSLAAAHPTIDYDAITAMYREALAIHERTGNLEATVGEYLRDYPRLPPDADEAQRSGCSRS